MKYIDFTRYETEEKFMRSYNIKANIEIFTEVGNTNHKFCFSNFWSHCWDTVIAERSNGVHSMLLKKYSIIPLYIHRYAHQLDFVLFHRSKDTKDVKLFIVSITLFHFFFTSIFKRQIFYNATSCAPAGIINQESISIYHQIYT